VVAESHGSEEVSGDVFDVLVTNVLGVVLGGQKSEVRVRRHGGGGGGSLGRLEVSGGGRGIDAGTWAGHEALGSRGGVM
jgi:hypothetical protein